MKTCSLILALALASCGVTVNPDGSKAVTVDAVALATVANAYLQAKYPPKAAEVKVEK